MWIGMKSELKDRDLIFRELVENSDDIIIVLDRDFRIRYISAAITQAYGVEPVSLLGRNILGFLRADKVDEWKQHLHARDKSGSYEIELELSKGVKSYFDVFVSSVQEGEAVQHVVLKLHDVTSRKLNEKKLISSNEQLDQVIYKTTHDLKAPLISALGLVNLAEKSSPEEKDEYITLIKKSLLKLSGYLEEMNHFFRNEKMAIQRERVDVTKLFQDELDGLKNLYQVGTLQVNLNIDKQAEFYSDLIRVKTIVTNILTNAIKYADKDKSDPYVHISVRITEPGCEIVISDNGIGIEPEYKDRIFDLFFRATTQSHGTGLGLFIVKDTIQRLKGSIDVQSTPGLGTSFKIWIPNQWLQAAELN
jgi:PAS domain S-box-containing protein